jgi:hypothetical protein
MRTSYFAFFATVVAALTASGADVRVRDAAQFQAAVAAAAPGTRILLEPGNYGGGHDFRNLQGAPGKPIVIAAADPKSAPVFKEKSLAIHLAGAAHVEIHDLAIEGMSGNGINIDNGGGSEKSAHHIILRGLRIRDVGGAKNADGIKLSGVDDFQVIDCTVERWGTGGGSAIDMVGCHRGVIEQCVFRHTDPQGSNAVQCKGGSRDITVRGNTFENPGGRGVNVGGSTGLPYFRPAVDEAGHNFEARNIRVEGNRFIGGWAPIAFVGVDGAVVRFNTIERPLKWAVRILQENQDRRFVPCRNGEFTDNLIIFESGKWSEGGVNIGGGTAPDTFKFARNWWLCVDRPDRSRPKLPVAEADGTYGRPAAEAKGKAGADALPKQ